MRTVILLSGILISEAIDKSATCEPIVLKFLAVTFGISIIMDLSEFVVKLKKK